MADEQERSRSQYPPPDEPNRPGYYAPGPPRDGPPRDDKGAYPPPEDPNRAPYYPQGSPAGGPPRDDRHAYPPPDAARQNQYPYDSRAAQYGAPPPQWAGQYGPQYGPDPHHGGYYPPPGANGGPHPSQDVYRGLPPPFGAPGGYYPPPHHYAQPPAPAPRQRTAIACKYCRKRKIRCSGYEGSPEGRCQNCVRFNQQCLFHPVSSQGAFVPASAVYGPNARAPAASDSPGDYRPQQRGYPRDGEQPMLYGAHGQPLGPVNPRDGPPGNYPPPQSGYPPQSYPNGSGPPQHQGNGPAYDYRGQGPPHPEQTVGRKRSPPDDDPHNENAHSSQSPHPTSRPRTHEQPRNNSGGNGYDYPDPTNIAPTSPATSTMSYQSHPPAGYYNNGNPTTQARNASPQSAHSYDSPRVLPIRNEGNGKTPPPGQPSSAGSGSASARSAMSVRDMLGKPNTTGVGSELRDRNDNEMLNKLDGKKK